MRRKGGMLALINGKAGRTPGVPAPPPKLRPSKERAGTGIKCFAFLRCLRGNFDCSA